MKSLPHARFLMFLAVFAAGFAAFCSLMAPERALVAGFDLGVLAFAVSCLPLWRTDAATSVRARAVRDDGGRVLLLLVSAVTLGVVLLALARITIGVKTLGAGDVTAVVGTLLLAWLFVNLVYAFHYAHLYYDQTNGEGSPRDIGGLQFPGDAEPVFSDFCYFSFVIGMTCQVSDVAVAAPVLRRVVLLHGVLSFVFNLGVLAMTINVLAGIL